MNGAKKEKLLLLYEVIGELDERTATEALLYKHKANIKSLRLVVVLAACICIVAATLIVGMNIALGGAKGEDPGDGNFAEDREEAMTEGVVQTQGNDMSGVVTTPAPEGADGTLPPNETQTEVSSTDSIKALENLMSESKASMIVIDVTQSGSFLYNGKLSFIWADEYGNIYAKTIESTEKAEALGSALSGGNTTYLAEIPKYKIWISFGDGRIITPYLEYSEENVFCGVLFDYQPKVAPSEKFMSVISSVLKNN